MLLMHLSEREAIRVPVGLLTMGGPVLYSQHTLSTEVQKTTVTADEITITSNADKKKICTLSSGFSF